MATPPPQYPADPATNAALEAVEEHLEVHLAVFVDERLTSTEQRLTAAFHADLAVISRAVALAVVGAVLAAVVAILAVSGLIAR